VRVVLASRSAARARLLAAAGVAVEIAPADIDEAALREALAAERVATVDAAVVLAEMKARRIAPAVPRDAIVLGCDQLLEVEGAWLDKPVDRAAARCQLCRLRGKTHLLATAVVAFRGGARVWHHVAAPRLRLRAFSDEFLDAYLERAGPELLGSVGAYQIEGLGVQLIASVEGDQFAVQGLPLLPVLEFLREQGALPR
jgi:septum formation protein